MTTLKRRGECLRNRAKKGLFQVFACPRKATTAPPAWLETPGTETGPNLAREGRLAYTATRIGASRRKFPIIEIRLYRVRANLRLGGLKKSNKPLIALLSIGVMIITLAFVGCGGGSSSSTQHAVTTPTPSPTSTAATSTARWIDNQLNVQEFVPSQLSFRAFRRQCPRRLLVKWALLNAVNGVIFDRARDLWVIAEGAEGGVGQEPSTLSEFIVADLSASGARGPSVTIRFSGFGRPSQGVFDTNGDLWVSDYGTDTIYEHSASQLAISGPIVIPNLAPNVQLMSNPALNRLVGMAFDTEGNLWVANSNSTTIFEFDSMGLPTAPGPIDTLTPNVVLSDDGSDSIQAPWAPAFDAARDLWSSNSATPFTVMEFAKRVLGDSGSPVPAVTISPTQVAGFSSLNIPSGITFDNLGGLAIGNIGTVPNSISLFNNAQIAVSGAPLPDVFVYAQNYFLAPTGMVFGPID